jgi:nitroreductase
MTDIIKQLNWRYATKAFDPNKKISEKDFDTLLEALRLSPSSMGLQPWRFVVVRDPALREQLKPCINNKGHVTDSSHLIALCTIKDLDEAYLLSCLDYLMKERGQKPENMVAIKERYIGLLNQKTEAERKAWITAQVYIALGVLLTTCAVMEIDACPVEGYDPKMADEILGLDKYGIESKVLCPVGYRLPENDFLANLKKVRYPKGQVIIEL